MKNFIFISCLSVLILLSSCATQSKLVSYNDDVYANPAEDRKEETRLATIKKQKQEEAYKRYNDSLAQIKEKQKALDDANPVYQDREFKYDDYYDYEYATRIKRFDNQINGLSYYDNYYTNTYWYNQNPYNYGTSVYNGYSWWGNSYNMYSYNPSVNFYYNNGWYNSYPSYGYMGYNPYNSWSNAYGQGYNNGYHNGYNNGYYNGWNGYPYNGYNSYGYNNYNPYGNYYGYGNGNNNGGGWGYYNTYDNNSGYTYGPRSSHGGGNSHRSSNAGMPTSSVGNTYYNTMVKSATTLQSNASKFDNTIITKSNYTDKSIRINSNEQAIENYPSKSVIETRNNNTTTKGSYDNTVKSEKNPDVYSMPSKATSATKQNEVYYNKSETINEKPVYQNTEVKTNRGSFENKQIEVKQNHYEAPVKQESYQRNTNFSTPSNNNNSGGGNSTPSNNGGSHSGGGGRPR